MALLQKAFFWAIISRLNRQNTIWRYKSYGDSPASSYYTENIPISKKLKVNFLMC